MAESVRRPRAAGDDLLRQIGQGAFLSACETPPPDPVKLAEIADGYVVRLDIETGTVTVNPVIDGNEITTGEVPAPL